jgi:hypothetical protein
MTQAHAAQTTPAGWLRRLGAPWRALKRELRDVLELFVVPSTAAWLPWPVAYRFFRWVVENTRLYGRDMPVCLRNARQFMGEFDETGFVRRQKMLRLLDQADYWLIRFRPRKATAITGREGDGRWPEKPGSLALCNHWGAGFLGIHDLRQHGKTPLIVFIVAPLSVRQQGLVNVLHQKMRRRHYHQLSGGRALTLTPGQSRHADTRRLLQTSHYPLLMVDTPKAKTADAFTVHIGGKTWRYPVDAGFTRLITKRGRDYTFFSVAFDYTSGRRTLRLIDNRQRSHQALLRQFENELNRRLAEDPGQWQFWHVADHILKPAEPSMEKTMHGL